VTAPNDMAVPVARPQAARPGVSEIRIPPVQSKQPRGRFQLLHSRATEILRLWPAARQLDRTYRSAVRSVVIKSFADKRTAAIFAGYAVRDLPWQIQRRARAKLLAIDAAKQIDDLRVPPGNRLESLHGDREGQHSIRINDRWRICFVWRSGEAWDVELVDYH
jgi:proteic killer suppression protein